MRMHLYRSTRSTWCGRRVIDGPYSGDKQPHWIFIPHAAVTRDIRAATCQVCIKANAAEDVRGQMASQVDHA